MRIALIFKLMLSIVPAFSILQGGESNLININAEDARSSSSSSNSFQPTHIQTQSRLIKASNPIPTQHIVQPLQPYVFMQNRDSTFPNSGIGGVGGGGGGNIQFVSDTNALNALSETTLSNSYASLTGHSGHAGHTGHSGNYGTPNNGQSQTYYYYHYPAAAASTGYGETTGYDDDDTFGLGNLAALAGGGFGSGGLGGILGIKGLKGLKGIGGLGILLALLKLAKPLLLPLLLPLFLIIPLALLFLPIPVVTIPAGAGRSLDGEGASFREIVMDKFYSSMHMAQIVIGSDECIERIACEINRKTTGGNFEKIVSRIFDKNAAYIPNTAIRRAIRAYIDSGSISESQSKCYKYKCNFSQDSHLNSQNTQNTQQQESHPYNYDDHDHNFIDNYMDRSENEDPSTNNILRRKKLKYDLMGNEI